MASRKSFKKKSLKQSKQLKKGGKCGCESSSIFNGGTALGPASFANIDVNKYAYPLNTHENDPNAPAVLDSTRMDPNPFPSWNPISGGKSKKNKIIKRKLRRSSKKPSKNIKGGDLHSDLIIRNPTFSSGTLAGAPIATNIVLGKTNEILNPPTLISEKPFI